MATKEDILEQIVEEYLVHQGYFVRHNVKFLPRKDHDDFDSKQDSNHSDIDVIGFHPMKEGVEKVLVVSCKSWQAGFNPASEIKAIEEGKTRGGREAWRHFRELVSPKWSEGFTDAVREATGITTFTHVTAVTKLRGNGDRAIWEQHQPFRDALNGNPIAILTFGEMIGKIQGSLTKTLAATEVGRMLQLFTAAKILPVASTGKTVPKSGNALKPALCAPDQDDVRSLLPSPAMA